MASEYLELEDDSLNITLQDLKTVLCMMKAGKYTFHQVYDWAVFFFYQMKRKLTYTRRYQEIYANFDLWEVGFEDDEIEYVIYCLCREAEIMDDEEKTDVSLLYPYIDDLLFDIYCFEREKERGNVMLHNLSELRKADIIYYFAYLNGDTQRLTEIEIVLYKKMILSVIMSQEGIYAGTLEHNLANIQVVRREGENSDNRLKYLIKYKEGIGVEHL